MRFSKMKLKRGMAMVFCLCLAITMLMANSIPINATVNINKVELTMNGSTTGYATFAEALNNASGNATIKILQDCEYTGGEKMIGPTQTIQSLTLCADSPVTLTLSSSAYFMILSGGTVNVDSPNLQIRCSSFLFFVDSGTVNMKSGTIKANNNSDSYNR